MANSSNRALGPSIASVLILLTIVVSGCGGASAAPSLETAEWASLIDPLANSVMKQQDIPGMTVAIAKNGTMLYAQAYGDSNVASKSPTQTNDIFEIGSITKQFTASLIMQLQQQGKLNIDDSLQGYLPGYSFSSGVTLRMLLNHTSGLADYTGFTQYPSWAANGVSEKTVLLAVSQTPLLFPSGTRWSYSNSNYFILGSIIENLTNQSYATNLEQKIFQPLGLTSTYFSLAPSAQAATGYTSNEKGILPAPVCSRSTAFSAGALSSNVSDLIAWDNALVKGKVVSPASFSAMITPVSSSIPGGESYGFGLSLRTIDNHPTIWHSGGINGFTAETDVFLDSGLALVVLTNSQTADPDTLTTKIMNSVCTSTQFSGDC